MDTKNTISFATDSFSQCCKNTILMKCTRHSMELGNNGIFGPGFHATMHTSVEMKYFCSHCGSVYEPTVENRLEEKEEEFSKTMYKLFSETIPGVLIRVLNDEEVFKIVGDSKTKALTNSELGYFNRGAALRMYHDKDTSPSRFFANLPYFVKKSKDPKTKIIFQSEFMLRGGKGSPITSTKSKTLPKASVPAVKVFHPLLMGDYYVPSGTLK